MVRWEPGTAQRLQAAALELFRTHGFEQTTAADIAAAAGVSERTFFRHFADKREVLFDGQGLLTTAFLAALRSAPGDATPLELIRAALRGGASFFVEERRPYSRARQAVIDADDGLRERERHKMADLAVAMRDALRERGVAEPAATLAAESGATVFSMAFARWIDEGETRSLDAIEQELIQALTALAAQ